MAFSTAMDAFGDACRELKEKGKCFVKNHGEIDDEGTSIFM